MDDYISRLAAMEQVKESFRYKYELTDEDIDRCFLAIENIKSIPTADVVEVVRCKDCKHRIYDGSRDLYYCEMYHGMGDVSDDNYCSFGERARDKE